MEQDITTTHPISQLVKSSKNVVGDRTAKSANSNTITLNSMFGSNQNAATVIRISSPSDLNEFDEFDTFDELDSIVEEQLINLSDYDMR